MTAAWRDRAACRGLPPDLFFLEEQGSGNYRAARQACAGCPVQTECLLDNLYEDKGFFGGLSPRQRVDLRKILRGAQLLPAIRGIRCALPDCLRPFAPESSTQIYCSPDCRDAAKRRTKRRAA